MRNLKILLFFAASINALTWIILIPVGQYPDEQSHFAQVQNIAEFGKSQLLSKYNTSYEIDLLERSLHTNRDKSSNNSYTYHPEFNIEYSNSFYGPDEKKFNNLPLLARITLVKWEATENPPLYYYLGSFFYKIFYYDSIFERIYAVRLSSAILFMAMIVVVYKIAGVVYKKEKVLQIALPALVAFMPMLVFSSTGVLPDPLTNLLFCIIIYSCVRIIEIGLKAKNLFLIIIALIFGFYTRQQFFISAPIIFSAIFLRCFLIKNYLGAALFTLILICLGLFLKTFAVFLPEIGSATYKNLIALEFLFYLKATLIHWYRETLPWYWGVYRWLSFTVPHSYYRMINIIIAFSLMGVIIKLYLTFKRREYKNNVWYLYFFICATLIYLLLFATGDYFFIKQYGYPFGIQGRYFFPLVSAHISIFLTGYWTLSKMISKKYAKLMVCLLVFLMILFNNLSLTHLTISYYSVDSLSSFIFQAGQYKPSLFKGSILLYIIILNITLQTVFVYAFAKKTYRDELS